MSDQPTSSTSNYGWALWHLGMAEKAQTVAEAQVHATCALARAQLQASCDAGRAFGIDPVGSTVWGKEMGES